MFEKIHISPLLLKRIISILILGGMLGISFAQVQKPQNHPAYDFKFLHFGFTVGLNTMDFALSRNVQNIYNDSLIADVSRATLGFNVSIVSEMRISDDWSLRFLPGITFGQREISFYQDGDIIGTGEGTPERTKIIESNYIDFPLLLKYKSKRLNNMRPYVIGGLNPRYDMAARKEYEEGEEVFVRLKKFDLCYEIGIGIDYFLQYFKLSTELKLSVGIRDMLVELSSDDVSGNPVTTNNNFRYYNSIKGLNSYVVMLCFHFE